MPVVDPIAKALLTPEASIEAGSPLSSAVNADPGGAGPIEAGAAEGGAAEGGAVKGGMVEEGSEVASTVLTPALPAPSTISVDGVLAALDRYNPGDDVDLVRRAYAVATDAHRGQFRESGEEYITHPIAVATIVAELGLDSVSVAAALLHDAVEDTATPLDGIEQEFGAGVAAIVDGVTKLDRLRFDSKEAQQAATMRKMLVAMAKDWRVLVIKLADRLHNMRTIGAMPVWKQRRSAQETLDIYAPLAHRLGIQEIKWQLEDLSFAALHPKRYGEIDQMIRTRAPQRDEELTQVLGAVRSRLDQLGIAAEVTGRPKHLWSIYEKMVVRGKEFDDIYDLVGIRVVVDTEKDCWAALGSIHSIWPPVPGRFKDYVNSPKFNLYQSLHTTVVLAGKPLEVQIRTHEMHRRAEFGIAAHWDYKERGSGREVSQGSQGHRASARVPPTPPLPPASPGTAGSPGSPASPTASVRAASPPDATDATVGFDAAVAADAPTAPGTTDPDPLRGPAPETGEGAAPTGGGLRADSAVGKAAAASADPETKAYSHPSGATVPASPAGRRANSTDEIAWLQRIVDWERDTPDPVEFLETLKLDLEQDEVYVFTPKGAIVTLPAGATSVDFAYAIHTEVGHRCIGARINGRLVPLDSVLQSGDKVEVFTSKAPTAGPSRDWLQIVVSPRARNKIRQWFSRERREDAIEAGREELVKAMRREGLPAQKLTSSPVLVELAKSLSHPDLDTLHAAIGEGHVSARSVVQRLRRELEGGDADEQLPATALQPRRPSRRAGAGVYVEGLDDMMVRLSRCCTPVPGDPIVGFVTRGRGVSVHRADCSNASSLAGADQERVIEVEWDTDRAGMFTAGIEVKALDRSRLLADVAKVLSEHHVNILSSSSHTAADRVSRMRFEFELADPAHLESLLSALRRLDSVYDAYRILPGKGGAGSAAHR
jgi:(p)ppGpp synthase/HD superfamily hydrolase